MSEDHPNRPPLPKTSPRLLRRLCRGPIDPAPAVNADDPSYLALGFVIAVLGMAGISYWVVQERSQSTALTKNVAEAPAPAMQRPAQNSPPAGGQSPTARSTAAGEAPASGTENSPPAREERPL